ncbi:MAG: NBR1-Ig-like domain-containing protein [Anaerolineaceae bacterium]|nr:NBR1-Ig-like domain-containing protein [Anaerolineaceae bacterium]
MNHFKKVSLRICILLLVFASACSPKADKGPTPDANLIYTSAAQTVQVQLTRNASENQVATNTVVPPTKPGVGCTAPIASNTPFATFAPQTTPTITLQPVQDKVEFISQNIADGSTVSTNYAFEMIWEVRNVGETPWNTDYQIRFFSGDRLGAGLPQSYSFTTQVGPNATYQVMVPMQTGSALGQFTSTWVLSNADGVNFYPLYITLNIAVPTATPTPTETLTPTITNTPTISPTT